MVDGAVAAAHGRGEPGPGRQLAGRAEAGDVADLGEQDQRGERAHAGQLGEHLDPRVGLGPLAHLRVQPVDGLLQGVHQRQGVVDDLAGDRRQLQRGEPPAARAAPAARRPAVAVVGQDRVDPVAQQGPQPDQLRPVPQHAPAAGAPPAARSTPPAAGRRAAAAPGWRRRPCRSSAAPRRSPCTAAGAPCAARSRSPRAAPAATPSRTRPRTPPACPPAAPRSPTGSASTPLGTLRLARTSPPSSITATWERLRWTSIPT